MSVGRTMVFSMVFITSFHSSFRTLFNTVFSQILANSDRLKETERHHVDTCATEHLYIRNIEKHHNTREKGKQVT